MFQRSPDCEAHAVDSPKFEHGLRSQIDVLRAERFVAGNEAIAHGVSAAPQAKTNAVPAMFDEQDAGFEVMISANQNGRNPAIFLPIGGNEIFKICAVVVLLAAAQAEFTNCRDKRPKFPFTDKDLGGSFGAFQQRVGSSYLEHRTISQGVMDSEQTS
jgi:hypothetical protein